jgi:hypothetical protein
MSQQMSQEMPQEMLTQVSTPMPKGIAYHGWGYDSSVWQAWRDWFVALGYGFDAADRGYFGAGHQPDWTANRLTLLTHSYGLHLALRDWQAQKFPPVETLVIFASFQSFHPAAAHFRRRSQQRVEQMIGQFELNPIQVLQTFWAKSAHPDAWSHPVPAQLNRDLLHQDLQALNQATLDLTPLRAIPQIWLFQGSADRILAPAQGQHLADQLAASYVEIEAAGHALPFIQAKTCQAKLKGLL